MYHLLSVSSAMLISFLIGLLFAAMCAIVGRQKGYSTALCILLGFFGRLICLLILILLPDRMQEQYESDHLKQELSSLRQRMAELEQALEPTPAPEPAAPAADAQAAPPKRPPDAPAVFPARTDEVIACPRCGRREGEGVPLSKLQKLGLYKNYNSTTIGYHGDPAEEADRQPNTLKIVKK